MDELPHAVDTIGVEAGDRCLPLASNRDRTRLAVRDIMVREVVTASPTETVLTATKRMFAQDVSCVVVTDDGRVAGILTQRDLLACIARDEAGFGQLPVAERMSSPTVVAGPELSVFDAGQLLKSRQIKYLPIVSEQGLVGLVTQTDITRGLICLTPLQRVSEIMTPGVTTISVDATVTEAARIMWNRNISCVVVMKEHEAAGVFSQQDVVARVLSLRKNPARTPVADVMSKPVLPVPLDYSVFLAGRIMDRMRIHRLVVQDGGRVCGIVSQTDILHAVQKRLTEEQKHREFLTCSDLPLFLLDAGAKLSYVNSAFLRLFELDTFEQAVGSLFSDEKFWGTPKDGQHISHVLRSGQSGPLGLTIKTSGGPGKRVLLVLVAARSTPNTVDGWQGVVWDVSDRAPIQAAASSCADGGDPVGPLQCPGDGPETPR